MDPRHAPVLLTECLDWLAPSADDVVVDATVGRGGHALELARRARTLVGVDRDAGSLAFARERIAQELPTADVHLEHASFVELPARLRSRGLRANALLADLGFSSAQMDDPARGFSFQADGPLDMRLDPTAPTTAADFVNRSSETELAEVIRRLGEEPLARAIARNVVRAREGAPIESTAELAGLVVEAYGRRARSSRLHPATRTFMALRIAVNDELGALERLLDLVTRGATECARGTGGDGQPWLARGARIAIIAFHSLEDRIVKHAFAALEREGLATRLTRKPVTAGADEIAGNPRARSAKLRVVRLVDGSDGRETASEWSPRLD